MTAPNSVDLTDPWRPQFGPQLRALKSTSSELLFGGAAFGGKSDVLLFKGLYPMQLPEGRTLILRASFPQIRELMDRAKVKFPQAGAEWNVADKRFTFPTGATYEFGYGRTWAELYAQFTGGEYDFIGYDEAGFMESERCIDLLGSRLRVKSEGLFTQLMLTANPGQPLHAILKKRYVTATDFGKRIVEVPTEIEIDGEKRVEIITREFIQAKAGDNPIGARKNPRYIARLHNLPDRLRKQLLEGDWESDAGLYFDELNHAVHIIEPFEIPAHWEMWGSFDWGFAHPFCAGAWAADNDGNTYLVDSVMGRRRTDIEIAHRLKVTLPRRTWQQIHSGHDCWDQIRARGPGVKATVETMMDEGLILVKANISRVPGWRNLRHGLSLRQPDGTEGRPRIYFFDTPTNREVFENLATMVPDPDDPEDVLKVDANPETGEGGDDPADMVRYGTAARVYVGPAPADPDPDTGDRDRTVFRGPDDDDEGGESLFPGLPVGF